MAILEIFCYVVIAVWAAVWLLVIFLRAGRFRFAIYAFWEVMRREGFAIISFDSVKDGAPIWNNISNLTPAGKRYLSESLRLDADLDDSIKETNEILNNSL